MTTESETGGGDAGLSGLTAGERAYLESGGANTEALLAEEKAAAPAPADGVKPPGTEGEKTAAAAADDGAGKTDAGKADPPAPAEPDDPDAVELADAGGKKQKAVPFGKFDRERRKWRDDAAAKDAEIKRLQENFTRGDERLRLLAEALNPPAQDGAAGAGEDLPPDPNQDIFGYVQWQGRQITRLNEQLGQTRESVAGDQAERSTRENWERDAVAFAREQADFGPAYNHLLQTRARMLAELGYDMPQIRKFLYDEERGLVEQAFRSGKRPAQIVYNLARQLGWDPKLLQPANGTGVGNGAGHGGNGKGDAAAAAPTNGNGGGNGGGNGAAAPSVTAELARIQDAQAAGKSLSGAGGAASDLSLEGLAALSDKEFEALYAGRGGQIDRLLGKSN